MTNPVILLGTQSNGETLPVQVDEFGRLVAEGLQGSEGPPGPPGPEGPEGPPGGGIDLPPDPYEGALLGWLNGALAWIGTPPVPIPEGVFGPILSINQDGFMTVEGEIPSQVSTGVYLVQVDATGTPSRPDQLWDISREWSTLCPLPNNSFLFNGGINDGVLLGKARQTILNGPFTASSISTYQNGLADLPWTLYVNGNISIAGQPQADKKGWMDFPLPQEMEVNSVEIEWGIANSSANWTLYGFRLDDELMLVDRSVGEATCRVNNVLGTDAMMVVPVGSSVFTPGQYLKIPEQRVASWVLRNGAPILKEPG